MFRAISFLTCAVVCIGFVHGANILMLVMAGTKSHKIPFKELAGSLISRGHSVTLASPFPTDNDLPNVKEIHPDKYVEIVRNFSEIDILGMAMKGTPGLPIKEAMDFISDGCIALTDSDEMKEYIRGGLRPDLIIMDSHIGTCPMALAGHMDVPFVYVNTVSYCFSWIYYSGYPAPEAVNPFYNFPFSNDMTFLQRVQTVILNRAMYFIHELVVPKIETHLSKTFKVPPISIRESGAKASFIFQNTHIAVSSHGPYFKNTVNMGGVHLKKGKDLPKDIKDFIDTSKDGVMYFSLGTSVIQSAFPEKLKRIILEVFARINLRVLWKWNGKDIQNLPKNVLVKNWFPQQDVLAHPKVNVFVTNGGIHSTMETIYHGVPAIFIPVYGDQLPLAQRAMHDGYGIKINLTEITADILYYAIMNITQNPSYRNSILKIQNRLNDNLHSPMENAMFWIEYVLRHKKTSHLKPPYRHYYNYQYYSIDVIAILCFISFLAIYTFLKFLKLLLGATRTKMTKISYT